MKGEETLDLILVGYLIFEPLPYGMREGRNYWNGIDLAAAKTTASANGSSKSMTAKNDISSSKLEHASLTDEKPRLSGVKSNRTEVYTQGNG